MKSGVEFAIRKYWESLVYSLRVSILGDVDKTNIILVFFLNTLNELTFQKEDIQQQAQKYNRLKQEIHYVGTNNHYVGNNKKTLSLPATNLQ